MAEVLTGLPLPRAVVMGGIIGFYLFAGCFVDALALILLTIPVFSPVVYALHYDPIWFGVIIVVVTQMGVISPPVGVNAYVVSGIERDIPLQTVFKGALPFLGALVVGSALLMLFPAICTYLPENGPAGMGILAQVAVLVLIQAGVLFMVVRGLKVPDATYGRACVSVLAKLALVVGVFCHFGTYGTGLRVVAGISSLVVGTVMTKLFFRSRWGAAVLGWGAAALSWLVLIWVASLAGHDISRLF
jgi:hypothetical protein